MNIGSEIANYADDNHLYYEDKCYNVLKSVLENDVISATAFEVGLSLDQGQGVYSGWTDVDGSSHTCIIDVILH